jgi:uncharacterized protein YnzC (UPF0291/DUF896 family)
MEQAKIDRINELARLAKARELTIEENTERQTLRREYLDEWRRGAEQVLANTYVDDGNGNLRRLRKKDDLT